MFANVADDGKEGVDSQSVQFQRAVWYPRIGVVALVWFEV